MASNLSKVDRAKLVRLFTWAQRRCHTGFHLTYEPFPAVGEYKDAVFSCNRHNPRLTDDANHFVIGVNRPHLHGLSFPRLRRLAVHEIIHAILWPISDCVDEAAIDNEALLARLVTVEETAVYMLQRAIVSEGR